MIRLILLHLRAGSLVGVMTVAVMSGVNTHIPNL